MGLRDWWQNTMGVETSDADLSIAEAVDILEHAFDFEPAITSTWPIASWSQGLRDAAAFGVGSDAYAGIYRSQPAVYTVVEFLAWQISQIGLKVYRREPDGEKVPLQDSPITEVLGEPAPGLTYERFMHSTVADLCVFGNAYWRKMTNGGERIIVPLRPQSITLIGGNIIEATTYRVATGASGWVDLPAEEVVHFRRHNPDDARVGVSPLEPLRYIIQEEREASYERVNFWRQAARMNVVLKHPTSLTDAAFARLRESWDDTYTGRDAKKTAILEEGTDLKEVSFSPKDAEFIAGRKLALETVARAFNIPVSVLGLTDSATFASQREFHKALYQDTLGPWLKMLEGEIKRGIVRWFTDDRDVFVEFNIAEKLKGAFEEQADALRSWVGVPAMTVNEWRARYNLPRIEDERFDLPVMPQNTLYGGVGQPGTEPMPGGPEGPETPEEAAASVILLKAQEG